VKKVLNKLKKLLATKVDKHGFEYTVSELVNMHESSKTSSMWHGSNIDNGFLKYKKSDTLFLLGSGPSINKISDAQWSRIKQKDSIGFNFWLAHDFVPNLYMWQLPSDKVAADSLLNLLENKLSSYQNVPFIIRGSAFASGKFDTNDRRLSLLKSLDVFYLNEYPVHSSCAIDPILHYKYVEALGIFNYGQIGKFTPKWRGTLGLLISFAYQMGYQKIVLCGMDMMGSSHFWDTGTYLDVKKKYNLPGEGVSNIQTFTDESHSTNTVPKYVYTMRDWMKQKHGVELFIGNEQTVLYPELPVYNFNN